MARKVDEMSEVVMAETNYGFQFGPALVERVWSHKGRVCITVKSGIQILDVYVTPTGQIKTVHRKIEKVKGAA